MTTPFPMMPIQWGLTMPGAMTFCKNLELGRTRAGTVRTAGYEMECIRRSGTVCAFDDNGVSGIVPAGTSCADVEIS